VQEAGGEVRIEWQPSADSNVVRYRLYYSSESILESEGVYDDFEETQGMENVFVFVKPPTTKALYITVLAVNNVGEESRAFVEEVRIDLSLSASSDAPRLENAPSSATMGPPPPVLTVPQSSSSSEESASTQANIPTHTDPVKDGRVHLLLAEALSPIQVKLTFSDPVAIDPQAAPQTFAILAAGGTPLRITQVLVSDHIIVADTEQQQKGVVYSMTLSEPLQGVNGEPLDPTDRTALFVGHEQGIVPGVVPEQQPITPVYDPTHPADVTGFSLRAAPGQGGTYTVTAQWQPDITRGDIAHYLVRQSLDGGRTFSETQMIPMDVAGVEFAGAQPGMFGMSLQVVNVYGGTSTGVFDSVTLPGGQNAVVPTTVAQGSNTSTILPEIPQADLASILAHAETAALQRQTQRMRSGNLPDSGFGLFAVGSALVGACVGWKKVKKMRK
jgi:hypothetical protein